MTTEIPPEATGLWRRREITLPDGRRDTTTRVLWLQAPSLFADLRVPADRPVVPGARGFADYSAAELARLAEMQGFAGRFEIEGDFCRWRRELDFQPPGGPPDEAHFRIEGDILVETGIHAAYEEIWVRETPPGAALAAFRLVGGAGILVVAGEHFLLTEERRPALPAAPTLAALVEADGLGRLDMLIAHGRIGAGWRIELATLPWLEGAALAAGFDAAAGGLTLAGPEGERRWQLVEASCAGDELMKLLAAIK
jgi:hypothetical protein